MDDASRGLTVVQVVLMAGLMYWLLVVKRAALDPRLTLTYGMLHWLVLGQVFWVFDIGTALGFDLYEPRGFSARDSLIGAILIFASWGAFLAGFSALRIRGEANCSARTYALLQRSSTRFPKTLWLAGMIMGLTGAGVVFADAAGILVGTPSALILPIGYLMAAGSLIVAVFAALGISVLKVPRSRLFMSLGLLAICALLANIVVIYPLAAFALVIAAALLRKLSATRLHLLLLLSPVVLGVAVFVQLAGKVYRRLAQSEIEVDLIALASSESFYDGLMRSLITFDSFNSESFALMLQSNSIFLLEHNYLFGTSVLAVIPVLKLLWGDIFPSFGKLLAVTALGIPPDSHTAFAVTPVGELAANFSYAGPLFFYFFLGLAAKMAYRSFLNSQTVAGLVLYVCFLVWIFVQQRGDFVNGNMYPIYVILVSAIVLRLTLGRRSASR